jgi:Xaa-Pro aminopeptidase
VVLFNAEIAGPGGYYTQLERTFYLGSPTGEVEKAYTACLAVQDRAIAMLRPGTRCKDIFRAIVAGIEESGHKMGLHPGHAQGLDIFERPLIDANEETELAANMIIVLHPHVLLPSGGGVWIGETFIVTEHGAEPLQQSPRRLAVV